MKKNDFVVLSKQKLMENVRWTICSKSEKIQLNMGSEVLDKLKDKVDKTITKLAKGSDADVLTSTIP